MGRSENKVAIVTGAADGQGAAGQKLDFLQKKEQRW